MVDDGEGDAVPLPIKVGVAGDWSLSLSPSLSPALACIWWLLKSRVAETVSERDDGLDMTWNGLQAVTKGRVVTRQSIPSSPSLPVHPFSVMGC